MIVVRSLLFMKQIRDTEKQMERKRAPKCWFTPQTHENVKARLGCSQEPGIGNSIHVSPVGDKTPVI